MRDPSALAARLYDWSVLVRRSGHLSLDGVERGVERATAIGRHTRMALELIVDNIDPQRVQEQLDEHARAESRKLKSSLDQLTEGILSIQAAKAPPDVGEMSDWFRVARRDGPVGLEPIASGLDAATDEGEHARIGLMLVADDQDPELVREILETNRDSVVAAFEQSASMVDAAAWYIQNEHEAGVLTDGLAAFLAPHDRARYRALRG